MSKAKGFLLAAAVAAMAFLLSCSEPLKPIERETWEEYQRTLSSSGGAANLSSSSEAANSSSAVSSSSEEPSSSSSTAIPSSSSFVPLCDGAQYNSDTQFCHNNQIVGKCNGKEYNPPEEVCSYGVVGKMCGSTWYNLQTHFCFGGTTPTPLCGGEEYTGSQFCRSGEVYDKCGSIGEYDPSKFYCHNGSLSSCGSLPLNPDTQFCSGSTRYDKCGGTVEYTPGTEDCCGSSKYTIATQFCYNNSKVGEYCGSRMVEYDPDLYQCKPQINPNGIYLKSKPEDAANKEYEAVLIGTQTWMAENLNYKTPDGTSRYLPTSGNTNDSDADNSNCSIYGRLYTWFTAMNNASSSTAVPSGVQGVCPSGWHLPSYDEWEVMKTYIGDESTVGRKLKATSGWDDYYGASGNGTDDFGFSALPGGNGSRAADNYYFSRVGDQGNWWSASEYEDNNMAAYPRMLYYTSEFLEWYLEGKTRLFSVRCVKD
jgi:uncharacterized protein (TIGR02145 family)